MKKFYLVSLTTIILTNFLIAQKDSLKRVYTMNTIYQKGNKYVLGSEIYKVGELTKLFDASPDGLIMYQQGYKSYQTGRVITWLSTLSVFGVVFLKDNKTRIAFLTGGFIVNFFGLRFLINGKDRIQKAIWIRNSDVLFGSRDR